MENIKQISEFTEIRHEVAKYVEQATTQLREAKTLEDKLANAISSINILALCVSQIAIKIDSNYSSLIFMNSRINDLILRLDKLEGKKSEII
jgi:hypothetical protein